MADEDGIVQLDLTGESQTILVSGENHTSAVDYDIRYIEITNTYTTQVPFFNDIIII